MQTRWEISYYFPMPIGIFLLERIMKINEVYKSFIKKKIVFIFTLTCLMIVLMLISVNIGSSGMTVKESLLTFIGQGTELSNHIVFKIRMPRVIGGIFVGMSIALSGMLVQTVLNNSLASPSTLGITNASAFGANLALIFLSNMGMTVSPIIVSFSSFMSAMLCMMLILVVANIRQFSKSSIILAGVAFGSLFSAATVMLQYFADDTQIATAVFWTFGDLGRIQYPQIKVLATISILSAALFYYLRWNLNAMDMGETTAHSLGVDVKKMRNLSILIAALNTGVSVAFVGMIGFIGLLSPQITKRIIGEDKRFMLPATLLMGATITLASDTLARTIIAPVVLPVGAITSFLGAPLFIYILLKERI